MRFIILWLNTNGLACVCFNVSAENEEEAKNKVIRAGGVMKIISVLERA